MKKKLLCLLGCFLLMGCVRVKDEVKVKEDNKKVEDQILDASFLAVGDNIIHSTIYKYNRIGNNKYSFDDIYENTNNYVQSVDFAYINQETICGGVELGLSNYPYFNGPYEVLDSLYRCGFDWVSGCSNHSMDRGEKGILNELTYMKEHYPSIAFTGLHDSREDAEELKVVLVNGMRIGLLDYTYGLNGLELPSKKPYLVDLIDKEKMKQDMERLNQVSDLQFVSIHWGVEYQTKPSNDQKELAQYLSDLGVDVIIGTHPHVIQPVEYLTGTTGNKTLVMYSLGNFLSAQDESLCMLGGMMKWNISYNKTKGTFEFKNVQFLPTVTQRENRYRYYRTYCLKDWDDTLANKHSLKKEGKKVSKEYYIQEVERIIGNQVEKVYKEDK